MYIERKNDLFLYIFAYACQNIRIMLTHWRRIANQGQTMLDAIRLIRMFADRC
jgi:hypothetical protein